RRIEHWMADAAESVAVRIGRLHEHRIERTLRRWLDRIIAQPQFVQYGGEAHPRKAGEPLACLVQRHQCPCSTRREATVRWRRPAFHPFGECHQQGTHERAIAEWI